MLATKGELTQNRQSIYSNDPAYGKLGIDLYFSLGPLHVHDFDFPFTFIHNCNRRFSKSWFLMKVCEDWLEYSLKNDAMYCYYCRYFDIKNTNNRFVKRCNRWNRGGELI